MNMIQTIDLTKRFGDFTANDHISLVVKEQEIKCIVGENGAGKSTLMNMLYGLLEPTEGKILIREKEVNLKSPTDAIANGIGMVHQHFMLVPSLTVFENILLGAEIKKHKCLIDEKTEIAKVQELIAQYHFELNPMDKIEDISVGSRQRVEILKMLYRNVDILILDEPTAVLTPQEVDELMVSLKNLKKQGKTIVVITHKLREVMELSDSVTVIKHGKVIGNMETKDTNEQELAQMMVGRNVILTVSNNNMVDEQAEIIYKADHISTANIFGKKVVDNMSFCVRKGEILGIAGVEGNGQSELVKIMSGLMETTEGTISFHGENITNIWPKEIRNKGIGIIPEDRYAQGLCKEMSLGDNIIAGYHSRKDVCRRGILQRKAINSKRDKGIKDFDIRVGDMNGTVAALSGGNAQKIIVSRELTANPDMLIACQPTRGVDIGSIEAIHKHLLEYAKKGNAVVLISSELSEIMSLSDRVIVMCKGKITGEIEPRDTNMMKVGLLMAGIHEEEKNE
ncbi:MAG: ABC transporter ATP-binding protein [Lachnospiraceae bacterium]|nr:ABC transporter ATP-binding protein [Lachnospiraceae bacterium]